MIFDSLFDYTGRIEIESNVSLEASLPRLKRIIGQSAGKPSDYSSQSHLRGQASPEHISLYRSRPLMGNYLYRPIFNGKLICPNHRVILEGKFSMSSITKFAFGIASIIFALMEILAIDAAFRSNESLAITVVSVIFFPAIFLFVVTAHLLLKLLFRGDVKWISDAIAASLK